MTDFNAGVVITVAPGRRENVELMLEHLVYQELEPERVVLVYDGADVEPVAWSSNASFPIGAIRCDRHVPGREQPRNVGVRALEPEISHVWFLDSDIIAAPSALRHYAERASALSEPTVLIGPYEWLPEGIRQPAPDLFNDWRWPMFRAESDGPRVAKLNVALGCFGGNLVWPVEEFKRVGGFHPQLHHGRCEDGELGLRAAAHRIPMQLVPEARGWHLWHPVNMELAMQRNARDVPLLNSWHPWVEQQGLIVTDQDGARFDFVCECGEQVNTLEMWNHLATHSVSQGIENDHTLILPEGL